MALTTNSDFASELVLNRIMNGQLKSDTGKTVTAGGRATASRLNATAHANAVAASNVAAGLTLATGAQNALTELVKKVETLRKDAAAAKDDDEAKAIAATIRNDIDAILQTQIDATFVLGGKDGDKDLGTVSLGLDSGNATVGVKVNEGTTKFKVLYGKLGSFTIEDATSETMTNAINELYQDIALAGSQYETLNDRYEMINDLNTTYKTASDNQAITEGGSASSLLSQII